MIWDLAGSNRRADAGARAKVFPRKGEAVENPGPTVDARLPIDPDAET
jgi:hypothetical protein